MRYLLATLAFISLTSTALAVEFMTINTKFFWDHKSPHEGKVVKPYQIPSKSQYELELKIYANAIQEKNVDIVGLTEIEGCHVARDLKEILGKQWHVACKEGRDTYTGQDVAILSRFHLYDTDIYNHSNSYSVALYGPDKGKRVRPSKAVTAIFKNGDQRIIVTTAHLVSRARDNDGKREAQARAIINGIQMLKNRISVSHEVIMGDFNDFPNSQTLKILKGDNLISHEDSADCSYIYRGNCQLLDHILTSINFGKKELSAFVVDPRLKDDHKAVYTF